MRWQYRDPALVWLFVPAYVAHLAEEYFGGFPEWFAWIAGKPLPRGAFLLINAVALLAMIAAVRSATRRDEHGWMAIAIATVLLVNGVAHAGASVFTGTYSPGLVTGVVFYLPLGHLALIRAWHQAPPGVFLQGVLAGLAAHAVVPLIAVMSV